MNATRFLAYSPLEVGDLVLVKGWGSQPAEVTEIETIHKASDNSVTTRHYIDGWCMPLSAIKGRLVDGRLVPIKQEMVYSETKRREV